MLEQIALRRHRLLANDTIHLADAGSRSGEINSTKRLHPADAFLISLVGTDHAGTLSATAGTFTSSGTTLAL
jgi:hypothetical protein